LSRPGGAFVTLHTVTGSGEALRGCIGHIEARDSLYETVKSVAYASAFRDYRFRPLTIDEYDTIAIEISVLSELRRITDPSIVVPGTHGLYVEAAGRAGILLPQVATEQGWERDEFLNQTCRKAGLPTETWRDPATSISIFTAQVFNETEVFG
jgi:AmmeMemoRadiSam system protein A